MKIKIEVDGHIYYRSCSWTHRWTGKLSNSPDWLIQLVEDGVAVVAKGDKGLMTMSSSGYIRVDVHDIIIKDGDFIDVIRKAYQ